MDWAIHLSQSSVPTATLRPSTPERDKDVSWWHVWFAICCNAEFQLTKKMRFRHRPYASPMIFFLQERVQKQRLCWTIWHANCASNLARSSLWMARCDAPKQSTGEIPFLKYWNRCQMDLPLSPNINLLEWKALDAAWRWCWGSKCVFFDPRLIMQPSHLFAFWFFKIRTLPPLFVCKEGWTSEVKARFLAAFNCNPMF